MKKIFLLLTIITMVFTSCDPLEDIYTDIDAQDNAVVGDTEYTLTDDDYDALDISYGSFNSEDDAKEMIPEFLTDMFPAWGKGSSALVEYNLYVGRAFNLDSYTLNQDDYTLSGSDVLGFQSNVNPADFLPEIIGNDQGSPEEGDYVAATYNQFTGSSFTVTPTVSLDENFDYGATAGDITTTSSGDWEAHSGLGDGPIQYATTGLSMTDYPSSGLGGSITYDGSKREDVSQYFTGISSGMVYASTLVNFSAVGDGTYMFHLRDSDFAVGYVARVGAKDDGSGNIVFGIGASSSSLVYGTTPFNLNTTYLLVSSYNIENGVANLYVLSTAEATEPSAPETTDTNKPGAIVTGVSIRQGYGGPTGTFDGIRVANTWSSIMSNDVLPDEVVGDNVTYKAIYTYTNDAWEVPTDNGYYEVTDADFVSMGLESFGSGADPVAFPEDYLATFLGIKFPYAQEADELEVVYTYVSSSSGAGTRGNKYTFTDGAWVGYEDTIATTLQFGHDGTTWVPDNTIKYTLIRNADYEYMASQLTGAEYAGLIGNLASYGDFDYNWSDEQIQFALALFLDHYDPSAANGQKYLLTYVIYDNGENDYDTKFEKVDGAWVLFE
jgi:hypothetical protein